MLQSDIKEVVVVVAVSRRDKNKPQKDLNRLSPPHLTYDNNTKNKSLSSSFTFKLRSFFKKYFYLKYIL